MPNLEQINHFLLHFKTYPTDDSVSEEVKRRADLIVTTINSSPIDTEDMGVYLSTIFDALITSDGLLIKAVLDRQNGFGRVRASSLAAGLEVI